MLLLPSLSLCHLDGIPAIRVYKGSKAKQCAAILSTKDENAARRSPRSNSEELPIRMDNGAWTRVSLSGIRCGAPLARYCSVVINYSAACGMNMWRGGQMLRRQMRMETENGDWD